MRDQIGQRDAKSIAHTLARSDAGYRPNGAVEEILLDAAKATETSLRVTPLPAPVCCGCGRDTAITAPATNLDLFRIATNTNQTDH